MGKCAEMRQKIAEEQAKKIRQFREEQGFSEQDRRLNKQIAEIQASCSHENWQTDWTSAHDATKMFTEMGTDAYGSEPRMPYITRTCQECDLAEETTVDRICPKCGQPHQFIGQCNNPTECGWRGLPRIDLEEIPEQYRNWWQGPNLVHYFRLYLCGHCDFTTVIADTNTYMK